MTDEELEALVGEVLAKARGFIERQIPMGPILFLRANNEWLVIALVIPEEIATDLSLGAAAAEILKDHSHKLAILIFESWATLIPKHSEMSDSKRVCVERKEALAIKVWLPDHTRKVGIQMYTRDADDAPIFEEFSWVDEGCDNHSVAADMPGLN